MQPVVARVSLFANSPYFPAEKAPVRCLIVSFAQNQGAIFYARFCSSASADFIFVTALSIIALITFSGKSERRKAGSFA